MSNPKPDEETVFNTARQIDALEARRAYLDQACAGDPAVRVRVEALLQVHEAERTFLAAPAVVSNGTADPPLHDGPGTMIGPYRLLEQLGEGGFGVVFLAEQTQPVRRQVALKVLKPGMDTWQVIARFEVERQALAIMDHPNIAKVFDAGQTASGRPYFVMELVKGVPITEYCDQNHRPPRDRLELFVGVCQAVQHAHQKGIIHRDLKPSNVIVAVHDGRPVPKVIDFGIAKAAGAQPADQTRMTGIAQIIGTPLYMSPEQAAQSPDIDTRTDIYSLGVLLYELLTGTTPFTKERFKQAAYDEIRRIIREEEPPKPSTRLSESENSMPSISAQRQTEPARLMKLVRGELDWIVMKALEKDRNRRYETANGLAMDVQRYLADEAVQAGPPSAWYRFRKFARRNKRPVLAASLVVLALVGGMIGTTWGLVQARAAQSDAEKKQQEANAERQKALDAAEAEKLAKETAKSSDAETQAVLDFVQSKILAAARPKGEEGGLGHDVPLRQAIEAALNYVETSFANQPLIEARLRLTLGTSFWYLGEPKITLEQYERARALYTRHRGLTHSDTLRSIRSVAFGYHAVGRRLDAIKLYEETLPSLKATLGPDHHDTLVTMHNLADSYHVARRFDDALRLNEETLARMKATLGPDHADTLMSMNNLANSYAAKNRLEDARKLLEETLPRMKATRGPDHTDTISCMMGLASTYSALDRHQDALELREKTVELREAKFGRGHLETLKAMNNLAISYDDVDRHEDALKLRKEVLERRKHKLGPDDPYTLQSMHSFAKSLVKVGRGAEAIPVIDECVQRAAGNASVHPRVIPWAMELRIEHFQTAKDAAGCRATAEMWEKLNRKDADSLYLAAAIRAVNAAVIRQDPKSPAPDAARLSGEQADAAMAWLKKAVAAGYKDVDEIKKDKHLDPLRERDEFKKLVRDLEEKRKE